MPVTLSATIESVLFVVGKPITFQKLSKLVAGDLDSVQQAVAALANEHQQRGSGLQIVTTNTTVQMTTLPALHDVIATVINEERTGELTRPSLETLAIVAYRSPITKAELEAIRGVNCSLIIRNLLIRGLIEETFDKTKGVTVYDITTEYLQLLNVRSVRELPDYERLHRDIQLGERLALLENPGDFFRVDSTV